MLNQHFASSLQQTKLRGLKTSWLETGDTEAPILLMLHGYPDSPRVWDNQVEYFAEKFRVICPYQRGTGPSPAKGRRRFSSTAIALDYLQLLQQMDPEEKAKIYLMGHDIGALQAWVLAPLLGKRLERFVVMNGLSHWQIKKRLTRVEQLLRSWYAFAFQLPFAPEFVTTHFAPQILERAYALGGLEKSKRPEHKHPERSLVSPINHYRSYLKEILFTTGPGPKIEAPTLILWGNKDPFLASPKEEEFLDECRQPIIRILQGGHWIQRELPDQMNTVVGEFLGQDLND